MPGGLPRRADYIKSILGDEVIVLDAGNVFGYNSSDSTPVLYRWADEPLYLPVPGAHRNWLDFDATLFVLESDGFHGTMLQFFVYC